MGAPAYPHEQALAGFPWPLDPVRPHVVAELPVHAFRGEAEGHLTKAVRFPIRKKLSTARDERSGV